VILGKTPFALGAALTPPIYTKTGRLSLTHRVE
jgi:hypothetical protein